MRVLVPTSPSTTAISLPSPGSLIVCVIYGFNLMILFTLGFLTCVIYLNIVTRVIFPWLDRKGLWPILSALIGRFNPVCLSDITHEIIPRITSRCSSHSYSYSCPPIRLLRLDRLQHSIHDGTIPLDCVCDTRHRTTVSLIHHEPLSGSLISCVQFIINQCLIT